jgi:hypothetical protein
VTRPVELAASAIDRLELSPEVRVALKEIHAELADAYRESFLAMVEAINKQASAIERIQTSLDLLIRATAPSLADQIPAVVRVANSDEEPDLASALVVADPIGAGYTLSITSFAKAVGVSAGDAGYLLKAFKLHEDETCAVVVRRGNSHNTIVNYHPRVIDKFLSLMAAPPAGLSREQEKTLQRVLKKMFPGNGPVSVAAQGDVSAEAESNPEASSGARDTA